MSSEEFARGMINLIDSKMKGEGNAKANRAGEEAETNGARSAGDVQDISRGTPCSNCNQD